MEWVVMGVGVVIGILGYLLARKDSEQGKQIDALWAKHDQDAQALQDLRLRIAENHYQKNELDVRFDRLESAFREGLAQLGDKFDHLAATLLKRMHDEVSGK